MQTREQSVRSGILLTVACYFLFALQDALIKWLVRDTSLWLIMFARSIAILLFCLAANGRHRWREVIATPLKRPLVFRGLLILSAWGCYYNAARTLPLAELTTLYFAAPVIVTLLAVPVLHETITRARWCAVLIGFAGVLIACRPETLKASDASTLALLAACLWATSAVLVRKVSLAAGSFLQMVYGNSVFALGTIGGTIVTWHALSWRQVGLLALLGLVGGGGQLTFLESMRRAPASVLAPFEYTALVWAFVLQYVLWGDQPGVHVFIGAAIIASSGFVVLLFDRPKPVLAAAPPPP